MIINPEATRLARSCEGSFDKPCASSAMGRALMGRSTARWPTTDPGSPPPSRPGGPQAANGRRSTPEFVTAVDVVGGEFRGLVCQSDIAVAPHVRGRHADPPLPGCSTTGSRDTSSGRRGRRRSLPSHRGRWRCIWAGAPCPERSCQRHRRDLRYEGQLEVPDVPRGKPLGAGQQRLAHRGGVRRRKNGERADPVRIPGRRAQAWAPPQSWPTMCARSRWAASSSAMTSAAVSSVR